MKVSKLACLLAASAVILPSSTTMTAAQECGDAQTVADDLALSKLQALRRAHGLPERDGNFAESKIERMYAEMYAEKMKSDLLSDAQEYVDMCEGGVRKSRDLRASLTNKFMRRTYLAEPSDCRPGNAGFLQTGMREAAIRSSAFDEAGSLFEIETDAAEADEFNSQFRPGAAAVLAAQRAARARQERQKEADRKKEQARREADRQRRAREAKDREERQRREKEQREREERQRREEEQRRQIAEAKRVCLATKQQAKQCIDTVAQGEIGYTPEDAATLAALEGKLMAYYNERKKLFGKQQELLALRQAIRESEANQVCGFDQRQAKMSALLAAENQSASVFESQKNIVYNQYQQLLKQFPLAENALTKAGDDVANLKAWVAYLPGIEQKASGLQEAYERMNEAYTTKKQKGMFTRMAMKLHNEKWPVTHAEAVAQEAQQVVAAFKQKVQVGSVGELEKQYAKATLAQAAREQEYLSMQQQLAETKLKENSYMRGEIRKQRMEEKEMNTRAVKELQQVNAQAEPTIALVKQALGSNVALPILTAEEEVCREQLARTLEEKRAELETELSEQWSEEGSSTKYMLCLAEGEEQALCLSML